MTEHECAVERSWKGLWWLPARPDDQLAGTLTFESGTGMRLEAIGLFSDPLETPQRMGSERVIHGRTTDSKSITLFGCHETNRSWGTGVSSCAWTSQIALIGAHADALEGLRIVVARATIPNLHAWSGQNGLVQEILADKETQQIVRVRHQFAFPDDSTFAVDGWLLTLSTQLGFHPLTLEGATIGQSVQALYEFANGLTVNAFLNGPLADFENFLALAVGSPIAAEVLHVTLAGADPAVAAHEIVIRHGAPRRQSRAIARDAMRFTLQDLEEVWPSPLCQLVAAKDEIRSALDLYFSVVNAPKTFVETQFLNLAQSAEVLHRGSDATHLISAEYYNVLREQIEAVLCSSDLDLDPQVRKALLARVRYWNEPSLRNRLEALMQRLCPEARQVLRNFNRHLVGQVVDARNYLTHRDPKLRTSAEPKLLIRHTLALRFLLEQSILGFLGVPKRVIDKHIARDGRQLEEYRIL
ncbi:MAG: HEPN domain-containing protein [Gemmatimonadaceae bacterium]